ncbi:MAG: hypothetical protein GXP29_13360 [Planctomycetes bacterium]|nr:hypothetical protein [Planctomycetota bacterium]
MKTKNSPWINRILLLFVIVAGPILYFVKQAGSRQRADEAWEACRSKLVTAGEPITLADIEARRPTVLPEDNGALVIERLAEQLQRLSAEPPEQLPFFHEDLLRIDPFLGIPEDAIEPMRAFLREHRPTTDALSELRGVTDGRLTILSYDFTGDNPLDFTIPSILPWRNAEKLKRLSALSHLIEGDIDSAFEAVSAQFGVASTLRSEPSSVIRFVRLSIIRGALSTVECLLRTDELRQEQLNELTAMMNRQLRSISPKDAMRGERACMVGLFESLSSGKLKLADVFDSASASQIGPVSRVDFRAAQVAFAKIRTMQIEVADDPISNPWRLLSALTPENLRSSSHCERDILSAA